jgi:hypothetical protein
LKLLLVTEKAIIVSIHPPGEAWCGARAVRFAVLAIIMLVFDRMGPPGREAAFLRGSQWRPVLSSAAQYGIQALPPEAEGYFDRLKRQRCQ